MMAENNTRMLSPGRHRRRREEQARRATLTDEQRHKEDIEWAWEQRLVTLILLGMAAVLIGALWLR
jgi:hypothetical protein